MPGVPPLSCPVQTKRDDPRKSTCKAMPYLVPPARVGTARSAQAEQSRPAGVPEQAINGTQGHVRDSPGSQAEGPPVVRSALFCTVLHCTALHGGTRPGGPGHAGRTGQSTQQIAVEGAGGSTAAWWNLRAKISRPREPCHDLDGMPTARWRRAFCYRQQPYPPPGRYYSPRPEDGHPHAFLLPSMSSHGQPPAPIARGGCGKPCT